MAPERVVYLRLWVSTQDSETASTNGTNYGMHKNIGTSSS